MTKWLFLLMLISRLGISLEVQGHRGARGIKPENSLPAFTAGIEAGADALELDLLLTKDEEVIIYHDYYINPELITYLDGRELSSSPLVYSLTLSQVKQFDCGRKTNPLFPQQESIPGTTIPTLEELFALIKNSTHPHAKKIRLNLEIKRDPSSPELTANPELIAKKVLSLVKAHGFTDRVYYSSFDPEVLFALRSLDPNATIAFLKEYNLEGMVEYATALNAKTVSPDHELIPNAEYVHSLQRLGFKVIPWTVNDPKRIDELVGMGIDGIITDYP